MWKFRWEHHTLTCSKMTSCGSAQDHRADLVAAMLRIEQDEKENMTSRKKIGCTVEHIHDDMLACCGDGGLSLQPGLKTMEMILHDLVSDGFVEVHNVNKACHPMTFTFKHLHEEDCRKVDRDLEELRHHWPHLEKCF